MPAHAFSTRSKVRSPEQIQRSVVVSHYRSSYFSNVAGVTDVKCDMDKKEIHVEGDADTNEMLQALLKWSKASGKSVELLS